MRLLVSLILLIVVGLTIRQVRRDRADARLQSIETLQPIVDSLNRLLPIRADADVEFTRAAAEHATLIFDYKLLKYDGSNVNVSGVSEHLSKIVCRDALVRTNILERGVTVKINILDRYGLKATTFAVMPNAC